MWFKACLNDAVKVLNLICAPPHKDPYSHLKNIRLLRMYGLTDYAHYEAITSLPFSGDMLPSALMSKMLSLLPSGLEVCFFLHGAFLKRLPLDVRSHLVLDRTSDPLSLALCANEIHQSQVSSASAINHIHSAPEDCPVLTGCSQRSPTPGPCPGHPSATPSASPCSDSPDLCWYHRNHTDRAQKCRALCSWLGN